MILVALGGLVAAIWAYLLLGRGFFWSTRLPRRLRSRRITPVWSR